MVVAGLAIVLVAAGWLGLTRWVTTAVEIALHGGEGSVFVAVHYLWWRKFRRWPLGADTAPASPASPSARPHARRTGGGLTAGRRRWAEFCRELRLRTALDRFQLNLCLGLGDPAATAVTVGVLRVAIDHFVAARVEPLATGTIEIRVLPVFCDAALSVEFHGIFRARPVDIIGAALFSVAAPILSWGRRTLWTRHRPQTEPLNTPSRG